MNVSSPTSSSLLLLLLMTIIFVTTCVQAKDVHYVWELDSILENEMSPDCMNVKDARRYSFLAERSFPGPLIEVEEGDIIHVRTVKCELVNCRVSFGFGVGLGLGSYKSSVKDWQLQYILHDNNNANT